MAANSIATQLQVIKSIVGADSNPIKTPLTRPSILFDPKKAADIDIETIHTMALVGLEALVNLNERFRNYKNDLFSQKSKDLDRELFGIEENNRINASISSYLRLLSGYFRLESALKTVEYLVRRYKVHVYNIDELILFALPYHETVEFVRIVQLIDLGNSRWRFLEGVKGSGAPPPKKVIAQQCIRDTGVLEVLCNYATPAKKYKPSPAVVIFCTAIVAEVLCFAKAVDSNAVNRVLPFVFSGLQSDANEFSDSQAGALMIAVLLANRVTLAPKLVKSLIGSVAQLARPNADQSVALQRCYMSINAIANIVKLQSVETVSKKVVDILKGIRDLSAILLGLSKSFNIDKFLTVLLESLAEYSDDNLCKIALISIVETVPVAGLVHRVVSRLLFSWLRLSEKSNTSELLESGNFARQILDSVNKKYPQEFRSILHNFTQDEKVQSKGESRVLESLCRMLDGNLDASVAVSDSRIWFSLEHPKAEVRRAMLYSLDMSMVLRSEAVSSQWFAGVRDVIQRRLCDEDLGVVQAALSMDRLHELISSAKLFEVLENVLQRCTRILFSDASNDFDLAIDTAISCLKNAVLLVQNNNEFVMELATLMFPLLLVLPKTKRLNLKAQEMAKEINWPFYRNLIVAAGLEKKQKQGWISAVNMGIVSNMAEVLSADTEQYMSWLIDHCSHFELSKTLVFFILLHSLVQHSVGWSSALYRFLVAEWILVKDTQADLFCRIEFNGEVLDGGCSGLLDQVLGTETKELNARILVCILYRLLKAYVLTAPENFSLVDNKEWISTLRDLYMFFAQFNEKNVFNEHLAYLLQHCRISSISFLSQFINEEGFSPEVQVESLHLFNLLCSRSDESFGLQLLAEFPSVLVPLSSDIQDIRKAAMNYVEELLALCSRIKCTGRKNGNTGSWSSCIAELLSMVVQQKTLILSDKELLSSLLSSILSSSCQSILLPIDTWKRFEKSARENILAFILRFALKLPAYAKLRILSLVKEAGADIMHVKDIENELYGLLEHRRSLGYHYARSNEMKSNTEADVLCLLLEICSMSISANMVDLGTHLLMALRIDGMPSDDPVIVKPCVTVLQHLNDSCFSSLRSGTQEQFIEELALLYRSDNSYIQNATREALLRINIGCSTIGALLDKILSSAGSLDGSSHKKNKKLMHHKPDTICGDRNAFCSLSGLLDILLLKKDMQNRASLVNGLFQLLGKIVSNDRRDGVVREKLTNSSFDISGTTSSTVPDIQQTVLLVLEDILTSLPGVVSPNDSVLDESSVTLLVEYARSATDLTTRNHVFSLFTTLSKIAPHKVLDHVPDVVTAIAKSTTSENDSHSRRVFENFISVAIPCWLSSMNNSMRLLQIFVDVMPVVAQHRRLTIIIHLLRTIGESSSFGSLLFLLFHSLVLRKRSESTGDERHTSDFVTAATGVEWEYVLAVQVCEQYTSVIWLPSLVFLLQNLTSGDYDEGYFVELQFAMFFILEKLQDPELTYKLESGMESELLQGTLGDLMEQVVCCLQCVDSCTKKITLPDFMKKELKKLIHAVLRCTTKGMSPSTFFKSIISLLGHADRRMRKKVLQLLCETVKSSVNKHKNDGESNTNPSDSWQHLEGDALDSFSALCLEILPLVDASCDDTSVQLISASALEVMANRFSSNLTVFTTCLQTATRSILSDDLAVASACLRTTGALINVLGSRALPEVPQIMENIFKMCKLVSSVLEANTEQNCDASTSLHGSVMMCVLVALEALIEKLGAFLSPYLRDIVELMVLRPDYTCESSQRLKPKADAIRRLLCQKIPARLALPPMQKVFPEAVKQGDSSVSIAFEMLTHIVGGMDRTSVSNYHAKLFDLFLLALDLRHQCVPSIKKIDEVEEHVLGAVIALTMKLTETMFKPLFIRSIEWAESNAEEIEPIVGTHLDRVISFYRLVNKLAENHRSLFVPYFKYLRDRCIHHLTDGDVKNVDSRKKKKAKLQNIESRKKEGSDVIALRMWHLRALVLSSLYKCFLYDSSSLKFLDSSNFQVLLKPVVSQLSVKPPASLEGSPEIPSVKEVDDLLVSCVGQMAVTAGSDLLWKPLNYEVLMQTRNEMVRSRILGLRIVKYLVENLKEEYLVLLAETIPFLVELLEDVELPVKTLAQDILKELESMSGEDLKQYF
ncbi:hypothetical protein Dimus_020868 [Dionaea muscipula]